MSQISSQKSCLSRGIQHCGFHICVLGTIGSGKTTLTNALQRVIQQNEGNCQAFLEPVSENPLLAKFYEDKSRYAFSMQIYMLNKRLEQQHVIQDLCLNGMNCVQDSSVYGDTCFVDMLSKDGNIADEEVDIYSELFVNMTRDVMYPSLVVYLNCSKEVALERVLKRGRECEKNMDVEYLGNLNGEIKQLCDEFAKYTYVHEINANADLTEEQIEKLAEGIYFEAKENRKNPILTRQGV